MSQKKNVTNNLIWRFLERCGAQGVTFVISIVLARLLDPSAYGTIALVTVFTTIMQVFVDGGIGNALIQKKNADDLDFSSMFFFNLAISVVLYILIFLCAPLIANFYNMPELVPVIRVLSLNLISAGIRNVQQAYVSRNMIFKRFFFSTMGATIFAAIVGIVMAYMGFGIWALVAQTLFNNAVGTLILWLTVKWRPKKLFSLKRLKELFSYGWKLLVSSLIDTVYNDLRQLIIGKMYSSNDLAQYNQGQKIPQLIITNINTSIDSVLLPTMSRQQDHPENIKNMTRRAIKTSSFIIMPLMVVLAVCAEPLVQLVLTEKWLPCVPYLRIFCFSYAFYPIHTANLNAIKAIGRSDLFLKLEIIKKFIGLVAVFSTMWFGVMAMACSLPFVSVLNQIINSFPNRKLLNYSYLAQLKDMLPQICISLTMGVLVYMLQFLPLPTIVTLFVQVLAGGVIYLGLSKILKIDSFAYLLSVIQSYRKKRGANSNETE